MKQFDHLSIFVSLIIALGFTHLIISLAKLIHFRKSIKIYWPSLVWIITLMLLQLMIWWVLFYQRNTADWMFFKFLVYLIIPIIISILGQILFPEIKPRTNLLEIYDQNRKWFFGLMALVAFIGLSQGNVAINGWHFNLEFLFQFTLLMFSLFGFFVGSRWLQLPLAIACLGWIVMYVSIFFIRLA